MGAWDLVGEGRLVNLAGEEAQEGPAGEEVQEGPAGEETLLSLAGLGEVPGEVPA